MRTKDFLEALKNFAEVVAIIIGAWWAIFRYKKARTSKESLIPAVSGKGGVPFLVESRWVADWFIA